MVMSGSSEKGVCNVYLCKTPLEKSFARGLGWLFHLIVSFFGIGNAWYQHWMLAFDYGEEEILMCEAGSDITEKLTGKLSWRKRDTFNNFYQNKTFLVKCSVPERKIQNLLKQTSECGLYHPTKNNCQTWAISFLGALEIAPPEEDQAEDVVKKVPGMSLIVSAVEVIVRVWIFARGNIS